MAGTKESNAELDRCQILQINAPQLRKMGILADYWLSWVARHVPSRAMRILKQPEPSFWALSDMNTVDGLHATSVLWTSEWQASYPKVDHQIERDRQVVASPTKAVTSYARRSWRVEDRRQDCVERL